MKRKHQNDSILVTTDLADISGGFAGPANVILAPAMAATEKQLACERAYHWNQNAAKPDATDGEKNYASYLNQFCPSALDRWWYGSGKE